MPRIRTGIVGIALAAFLAGCGESTSDEGPGGFKPTDVKPLDPMLQQMQEVAKTKAYNKRQLPPETEKGKEKEKEKKK